jgi:light-regulated signal transduction histidine kinase (bacteriophytochrome)
VRQGFQDTDLVPLVEDLVELYGPIAEEEGGQVELALPASAIVKVDAQLVAQALTNLLDNAMKYGRDLQTGAPAIIISVKSARTAVTPSWSTIPVRESPKPTGNGSRAALCALMKAGLNPAAGWALRWSTA